MGAALRRTFGNQPNLTMLGTGLMTLVFGLILWRPGDTFPTASGWDILARVTFGPVHPNESQWGARWTWRPP